MASEVLEAGITRTSVRGVTLHRMRAVHDPRGNLTAGEVGADIPFEVRRYFLVHQVPSMSLRGEHAHHACHQFLVAVHGSIHVTADDGFAREEFVLDRPHLGLYLPPMVWGIQHEHTPDAVLMVLASHAYDGADYIRDYGQFVALARAQR